MIDPITFNQIEPNNAIVPIIRRPITGRNLSDDEKILLNPLLYGFSLGDKLWGETFLPASLLTIMDHDSVANLCLPLGAFAVARLEDVAWNDSMIESLVMSQERKDFIRHLIRHHGHRDAKHVFDDLVRDKGKGLIGLLAGPPGVGKTLTAEAVAEIAHRPLYMISSGELGETSVTLQKQLMAVMELAETWKAVVLLDEADVFLAQRDNESLSRNAITSIFLRYLEYYQGILLLTTNRLSSCDEAFQSRIHFCFEYQELNEHARGLIWRTFLGLAKKGAMVEVQVEDVGLEDLARLNLNGRQIKNIVSIAQAVAADTEKPITLDLIHSAAGFASISWTNKEDN